MKYLTKSSAMAIKSIDDAGVFEGYASIFGNLDAGGDIVVKGAYLASLRERGARGVKLLREHNPSQPVGVWEELREDDTGLFGRGRLLMEIECGRETHALMKVGAIDGLSIGYRVVNSARDAGNGARLLTEIDLREVSLVTFPMNEESRITSVKGDLPTEREFERWLTQDAGFTRSQARQIITGGFKSLPRAERDAGEGGASDAGGTSELARMLADLTRSIST